MPKNLSLPSLRTGPESCSIFSNGLVKSLLGALRLDPVVDEACTEAHFLSVSSHCSLARDARRDIATYRTAPQVLEE